MDARRHLLAEALPDHGFDGDESYFSALDYAPIVSPLPPRTSAVVEASTEAARPGEGAKPAFRSRAAIARQAAKSAATDSSADGGTPACPESAQTQRSRQTDPDSAATGSVTKKTAEMIAPPPAVVPDELEGVRQPAVKQHRAESGNEAAVAEDLSRFLTQIRSGAVAWATQRSKN